jgi:hypothetical protein
MANARLSGALQQLHETRLLLWSDGEDIDGGLRSIAFLDPDHGVVEVMLVGSAPHEVRSRSNVQAFSCKRH